MGGHCFRDGMDGEYVLDGAVVVGFELLGFELLGGVLGCFLYKAFVEGVILFGRVTKDECGVCLP